MIKLKDSIKAIKFTGSSKSRDLIAQVFKDSDITFLGIRIGILIRREMKKLEDDLFKNGTSFI